MGVNPGGGQMTIPPFAASAMVLGNAFLSCTTGTCDIRSLECCGPNQLLCCNITGSNKLSEIAFVSATTFESDNLSARVNNRGGDGDPKSCSSNWSCMTLVFPFRVSLEPHCLRFKSHESLTFSACACTMYCCFCAVCIGAIASGCFACD